MSCPTLAVKKIDGKIIVDYKKCSGAGICSEHGICIEKYPAHALKPEGERKTVAEIMEFVMQDLPFYEESGGSVTFSGGEATMQPDFVIELLKALKEKNFTRQLK